MARPGLLLEGVADAIGFMAGALAGVLLAGAFGLDLFAPGYSPATMAAVVMAGAGGGLGLQLARRFRNSKKDTK